MEPADTRPQVPWASYDAPPEVAAKDNKWLWVATALDAVLNGGESAPQYLAQIAQPDTSAQQNWKARNQAMNDASTRSAQQAQAARASRTDQRDTLSRERWQRQVEHEDALRTLDSPQTAQAREAAIASGVPAEQVAGMTGEQIMQWRPQLGTAVSQGRSFENATVGREHSDQLARRRMALNDGYANKRITYQDYLRQLQAIDEEESKKTAATDSATREETKMQKLAQIPGWERAPDAPPLTEKAVNESQSAVVALEKLRASVGKLAELRGKIGAADMAKSKLGIKTEAMAVAEQEVQNAANAIRQVANFGTPQAGEMAITYARVPEMASLDSWVNGAVKYEALLQSLDSQVGAELGVRGYRRLGENEEATPVMAPARAPKRKATPRGPETMRSPAVTTGKELTQDEWDELQDLGGDF